MCLIGHHSSRLADVDLFAFSFSFVSHIMPSTVPHKSMCGTCLPKMRQGANANAARQVTTKMEVGVCALRHTQL